MTPAGPATAAARPRTIAHVPGLDGLRGLAVLAVVAFHLWPGAVPGGWLGVDLFFVLSGYLITTLLVVELGGSGRVALGAFWARRARRLLPAALLVVAAVVVAARWWVDPWRLGALRGDALASVGYVANWRFIATGNSYFAEGARSPLEHLWSLAIEEQFYVVWPLLLVGLWRVCGGRARAVATVALGLAGASAVAMAMLADAADSRAYFGTDTRVQTILLGSALALWLRSGSTPLSAGRRPATPALGVAAMLGLAVLGGLTFTTSGDARWLYRGGFLAIAAAGTVVVAATVTGAVPALDRLLSLGALRTAGRVSYGLYLWHWPVIVLLTPNRMGVDGLGLDLIHIAVFTALTVASYRLLELPIRHSTVAPRQVALRSAPAVVACVGVVLLAATGAGAPPPQLQEEAGTVQTVPTAVAAPPTAAPGPTTPGETTTTTPADLRVGVIGDSVGFTLAYNAGVVPGLVIEGGGTIGCGLVPNRRCVDWLDLWTAVGDTEPEVVLLVLGAWEIVEQTEEGNEYVPGTEAARALLLDRWEEGLAALPSEARLAVVAVPCMSALDGDGEEPSELIDWVNEVFEDFVARHADRAELIPIADLVCPDGDPTISVDGVRLRPEGRHYDERSAPIVWRWLQPRLEALASRP